MTPLYKYIANPDAAQFLLRGVVKFTPIPELNDPSELMPTVIADEVQASLARLRRDGYTDEDVRFLARQGHLLRRLAPGALAVKVPHTKEEASALIRSPFYDSTPVLERLLDQTAREMSSKVGLFCLSRRCDSLPMWAHYAGNASGLVVEFADLSAVFPGDETGVLREPIPVRYEREHWGVTFDPRSHESLFFAKFRDWSYEQEVRVVLPLADCRRQSVGGKVLHLFDVPVDRVRRVILGWNLPREKAEVVRAWAGALPHRIEVARARFVRGRVELEAGRGLGD